MALLLQTPRGARALSYHLLVGTHQGVTAGSGGGVPPITTDVLGERLQPASRSPGPASWFWLLRWRCVTVTASWTSRLSLSARDNWCREGDRYRTWTHDQVTAGKFGRV